MGQLREQLIGAFHEQMDVRRRLLELENQAMEVQIDTSRHLLTIAGYAFPDPGPSSPPRPSYQIQVCHGGAWNMETQCPAP